MKKNICLIFGISFLTCIKSFAQIQYTGLSTDNFAGYTSSFINPATITNSTNKFFVSTSLNQSSTNNYLGGNTSFISRSFSNEKERYRNHVSPGYDMKNFSFDLINAYYEINHKNSIGYSFRIRQFGNVNGLPRTLTSAKDTDFDETKPIQSPVDFKALNFNQFIYSEHRFHYGRVIFDEPNYLLKVGGALKIINGVDATYLYADKGSFSFTDDNNAEADFTGVEFKYGRAEKQNSFSSRRLGVGLDLGIIYEYRPKKSDFVYEMDGVKDIERYDQIKYLYRLGASITDIGRVRFSKDPQSYDFVNTGTLIDVDDITSLGSGMMSTRSFFKRFDDIANDGTQLGSNSDKFNMNLPTLFNLQGDYRINEKFYANWTSSLPIHRRRDPHKSHFKAIHTLTPRYETSELSVMMPISFQRNAQVDVGIASRYMIRKTVSIFLGANNISGFFGKRASFGNSYFAGVAYVIPYKLPKDRDGDKVSDLNDECVNVFGLLEFAGCPDIDGDGVPDHLDKCMYDPGPVELKGCPDTDGDGIPDIEDHCIFNPGPKQYNGCPDTDGDGLIDINDQCPTEAGLHIHYGCPDRDGDGVIDIVDQCPDVPGIELNNGCPFNFPNRIDDRDGDGVPDAIDDCPDVPGSVYNKGCPIDKSNLSDINLNEQKQQKDPNHTITKVDEIIAYENKNSAKGNQTENKENSVKIKETKQITNFNGYDLVNQNNHVEEFNIYFNVDDATISKDFDLKLREIAAKYGKGYSFTIVGHTDNDGSEYYNLILSRKRAEVVKRKLMTNNINENNIEVLYFGKWKPLKKNTSIENKQFNRRVEVFIKKTID
jgi:outer membrane protein OmpA-like peptidoglycan-associated protein